MWLWSLHCTQLILLRRVCRQVKFSKFYFIHGYFGTSFFFHFKFMVCQFKPLKIDFMIGGSWGRSNSIGGSLLWIGWKYCWCITVCTLLSSTQFYQICCAHLHIRHSLPMKKRHCRSATWLHTFALRGLSHGAVRR